MVEHEEESQTLLKFQKFYEMVAKNLFLNPFRIMVEFCSAVEINCSKFVFSLSADFDFFGEIVTIQFSYS